MTKNEFATTLQGAVAGGHDELERILELYQPLFQKYSYYQGIYNEDLHQYLLIHIALNINKFPL